MTVMSWEFESPSLHHFAEIAQLVEHNLAKVGVASSSLVFRSVTKPRWRNGRRARFRCVCREACRFESCSGHHVAEIAQLVEHNLAKVGVASSSLVFRSRREIGHSSLSFFVVRSA